MKTKHSKVTFKAFYPDYLAAHSNIVSRRLHFAGSMLAIACIITAFFTGVYGWLLGAVVGAYGFAWVGHFFFEKNKPASFTHPLLSFMGDWVMVKDIVLGRVSLIHKQRDTI